MVWSRGKGWHFNLAPGGQICPSLEVPNSLSASLAAFSKNLCDLLHLTRFRCKAPRSPPIAPCPASICGIAAARRPAGAGAQGWERVCGAAFTCRELRCCPERGPVFKNVLQRGSVRYRSRRGEVLAPLPYLLKSSILTGLI